MSLKVKKKTDRKAWLNERFAKQNLRLETFYKLVGRWEKIPWKLLSFLAKKVQKLFYFRTKAKAVSRKENDKKTLTQPASLYFLNFVCHENHFCVYSQGLVYIEWVKIKWVRLVIFIDHTTCVHCFRASVSISNFLNVSSGCQLDFLKASWCISWWLETLSR